MKTGHLVRGVVVVLSLCIVLAWGAAYGAGQAARSIRLKAATIDTSEPVEVPAPVRRDQPSPRASRYFIVQSAAPVDEAFVRTLEARGARIISYLPDDAFLVEAAPAVQDQLNALGSVRWSGPYRPEYKVAPGLTRDVERGRAPERLTVLVFAGADVKGVVGALAAQGLRFERYSPGRRFHHLTFRAAPRMRLERLAAIEGVAWIEPQRPLELIQAPPTITGDVPADIMNLEEVWSAGFDGAGQIVGICDTGLDVGINGAPLHDDFEGRLLAAFALGRPGDWSDDHGHGTHVAGTSVGDGARSGGLFRGGAWGAELVFQSAYVDEADPLGGIPPDLYTLFEQAYGAGARIHSNSWGSPDRGRYSAYSEQVDEFMWDHKDMLIVFACGNDGVDANNDGVIDLDSLYSPATAKNCLAVGASENVRETGGLSEYTWGLLGILDGTWQAEPIYSDPISDNEDGLAAFSSHGPCDDGRIKPDVVAPGTDIISCRTQDPVGYSLADYNTWGVYDNDYVYMGGTSMAAPAAAGATALVRQYLVEEAGIADPSAALVKAALINGAYEMTPGQYGVGLEQEMGPRPNNAEGWGRIDAAGALLASTETEISTLDIAPGLSTGGFAEYEYIVGNPGVAFRVTLVYTDYPGNPAAAVQLVNDLDLVVTDGNGVPHYPNRLSGADRLNNVEMVEIATPTAGTYTVRVNAHSTPYGPQPYALVVSRGKASGAGHVVLNKIAYGVADTAATITVVDTDIAGGGTQNVTVTSTSDPSGEVIALTETTSGVFAGQVGLTTGTPGVGQIHVAHGDTITAVYHDADHGAGSPQDVYDTASVDLVIPTIVSRSLILVDIDRAAIGWTTSEACNGVVHYGEFPALGSSAVNGTYVIGRTIELTGLQPNTRYYYSIESTDAAGNTVTDDNGGALYTFATGYGAVTFADDMEDGPGGWIHSGDFDQWEYGVPAYLGGPSSAHSPENCWGTNLDGYFVHDDYFDGYWIREGLVSPSVAIGQGATLTFWHWYDLVAGSDEMTVEISQNGGPWQDVTPGGGYDGASFGWVEETIDLSAFANSTIRIRFNIWADVWFDYLDPHAGWYVDDVEIATLHAFGYGDVTFDRSAYGLATPVVVTVTDGHENDDALTVETVSVNVSSDSEPAGETLVLTETGANTGMFSGTILLSATVIGGDGKVGVVEGDTVTARYTDLDDGLGGTNVERTATAVTDLDGPSLSGLTISEITTRSAIIEFTSDPGVAATVAYGTGGVEDHELSAVSENGEFAFTLDGLQDNTRYTFTIIVEDAAGNAVPYNTPPSAYSFGTRAAYTYAANAFDGETSELEFSSDNAVWELGTPEFGPNAAHSPPACWATDLDGPYPITCDVAITSGWITLEPGSEFSFEHWYGINEYMIEEEGYGIVEITTNGTTWQDITPTLGGYVGASLEWLPETINLFAYGSQNVRLRFRLYSQESDIVLYDYPGWYVDDVALVKTIPFGQGALFFDRDVYSLSTPVEVMLIDAHLNANPDVAETVMLSVSSSKESLGITLTETASNSGKFLATCMLDDGPAASDALLQVAATDTISVQYNDADDGTGSPALANAQANVDLVAPQITGLAFSDVSDTSFTASWTTNEPCIGTVYFGKTTDAAEVLWSAGYVLSHSTVVSGLDENAGYFVRVSATDAAGNEVFDDNGGAWHRVYTQVRNELFLDDFDRDEKGWTHSGVGDEWERGVPALGVSNAASPPYCWATDLDGNYEATVDASLVSPSIALASNARLSFNQWYSIEEYGLDDGVGTVEVSANGVNWTNISRDGGYTGKAKAGWHEETLSLASFGTAAVQVRYRLSANQTIEYYYPGWYLDDVSVYVLKPYGYGVLRLDRSVYTIVDQVIITLKDGHLNSDPGAIETVSVSVSSTTQPGPTTAVLTESDAASGIFFGAMPISLYTGVGSVRISDGDTITVSYTDADNAEGGTNVVVTAQALVSAVDTDGDGMPDAWEIAHGLDPYSGVGDDGASGDPDGDGSPNGDELAADTDPQNPGSLLAVVEIEETPEGFIVVRWQSRPNKLYRVYWSTDRTTWLPSDVVTSAGAQTEWTDISTPSLVEKRYKIQVLQ
ncbi:MAG: S8 family serine peptidase [Verrucomicrobia bacterium]|nr:S8 family serine peptidase [Verrucomicrobiota bacterium]